MIPRYSRKDLVNIWTPENKIKIWLNIEILACEAQEKLGNIPKKSLEIIKEKASFEVERIDEIEKEVKHDVIAFLTNLSENIGIDARFIHQGMTSSDVLDTCLSVQLKQSCQIIKKELLELIQILKDKAIQYKNLPCIGRSHGIYAEPTTFGLKILGTYCEFLRNYKRLQEAEKNISTCAISGAVGTFANIDPFVEEYVSKKLNLSIEPVSTQIIPRDRHAHLFSILGIIASSIENFSTEIRHLQRSEVREVEEFFSKNQKGSSAMPHKRNPVLTENLTGISRIIRSSVIPMMENITLWHERDISHSSVERIICPDTLVLLDFSIHRLKSIVKNLVVNDVKMKNNLDDTKGLFNSQRVMLELIKKGNSRENSYKLVQKIAMKSWQKDIDFKKLLLESKEIKKFLNKKNINDIFDLNYHFKNIDKIFDRVLG
jgi:adenylosuccinate lyase